MRLARVASLIGLGLGFVALSACTALLGDYGVGETTGPLPGEEGGTSGGNDGAAGNDASKSDSGVDCPQAACLDPSTVKRCDGTTETCAFGCVTAGGAHCAVLQPSPPLVPEDLGVAGTTDVTIAANTQFFTETGAIENVRASNKDPSKMEVNSGIGFRVATGPGGKVAVWTFKSLTVPTDVVVRFDAAYPVAFAASSTITIVGVVDARGYDKGGALCAAGAAGPGGGAGGGPASAGGNGAGLGAGLAPVPSNTFSGGASGGSFGGVGGGGGDGAGGTTGQPGALPGRPYGTPDLRPLVGGSGGGGAGAPGGGGGGAVQLVAVEKIVIGGGSRPGGVNAGGCNGHGAAFGTAGSAGGSGGAILVETPNLAMQPKGVLAANGGAGATGGGSADPMPGQMSSALVFGSPGAGGYGGGGQAGVGSTPNGVSGFNAVNANGGGGSGGGAAGRIRINNRSATFTPPVDAVVTPAFGIAPNPPTSAGPLDVR